MNRLLLVLCLFFFYETKAETVTIQIGKSNTFTVKTQSGRIFNGWIYDHDLLEAELIGDSYCVLKAIGTEETTTTVTCNYTDTHIEIDDHYNSHVITTPGSQSWTVNISESSGSSSGTSSGTLINGVYYELSKDPRAYRGNAYVLDAPSHYQGSLVIPSQLYYNKTFYDVRKFKKYDALDNCDKLISLSIPGTLNDFVSIDERSNLQNLRYITVTKGLNSEYSDTYDSRDNCNAIIHTESNTLILGSANTVIPNSVTEIRDYAFANNACLTSLTIPNSVTELGEGVFYNCTGLETVSIPNSVTSIGYDAFYGCTSLTSVTIPNSVTSIGGSAFQYCTNLTDVSIPNSVTSIGYDAFYGCTSLTNITIPNSVTSIGHDAFKGCTSLTNITIPNSVTSLSGNFEGCTSLTSVVIPNSVTSLGWSVFKGCTSLTSVVIPNSVTSIGIWAFYGCTNLKSVTVSWNEPLTNIGGDCFSIDAIANATLYVPVGTVEAYKNANGWKNFGKIVAPELTEDKTFTTSIIADEEPVNATFKVIDAENNYVRIGNGEEPSINDGTTGNVVIPSYVTGSDGVSYQVKEIADGAFLGCYNLTSITLPQSIEDIGEAAFADCYDLTTMNIPASVTTIGADAFMSCGLTAVAIPQNVATIGSGAFTYCNDLTSVTVAWSEPIVIDEDCFTNAANATLHVPAGTKNLYKTATGWKEFGEIVDGTENILFADDVIACRGGQVTLPIELCNEENIRQIQFELSLPEGISVVTKENGDLQATLTQRASSTHQITGTYLPNGNYLVIITRTTLSDDVIQDSEGRIASISLKVRLNVAPGDYDIKITDCEFSIKGVSTAMLLPDSHSKLTISSILLGDSNHDDRVSVSDISNVIDYILKKNENDPDFMWHAANASGDERISVSDISTIIDIILHKEVFGEIQATKKDELDPQ